VEIYTLWIYLVDDRVNFIGQTDPVLLIGQLYGQLVQLYVEIGCKFSFEFNVFFYRKIPWIQSIRSNTRRNMNISRFTFPFLLDCLC
jgi:hypothetical protein